MDDSDLPSLLRDYRYREIPDSYKHLIKNKCYKCGSFPIIEDGPISTYDGDYDSYLRCSNKDCYVSVPFNNTLKESIEKWNQRNEPLYIPKSDIEILNNCNKCKLKNACKFARNSSKEYLSDKSCNDFK